MIKKNNTALIIRSIITILGLTTYLLKLTGTIFLIIGSAALTSFCLTEIFILKNENRLNITLLIFSLIWFIVLGGGVIFNNGKPVNYKGFFGYLIYFGIIFLYDYLKKKKQYKDKKIEEAKSSNFEGK